MSNLFRKKALDTLAAPDRLDERLTLISPRRWLALATLAGTLALAALWGTTGRISTKVHGAGMLLEESGFRNVASLANGVIGRLNVREGDPVEKGDVLGLVALPLQEVELQYYRDKLTLLRSEMDEMNQAAEANRSERAAFFENMRIDIEKADYDLNFKREFWRQQSRLVDAEFELQSKMDQYLNRTQITSPARGTIVNVQKSVGDPIASGEVVFLLQPSLDDHLYAAAFIPAAQSKNVRPGQTVYVAPSHIEPQRAGYVVGTVRQVGRYPATFQQLVNVFKNRDLADMLKGDEVAVTIEVDLVPDPGNPTGVRWTGRPPAGTDIGAGMICSVAVVVEQRSPISFVLPWIREKLLGEARRDLAGIQSP
jgi:HlyD family secretion protein